MLNAAISYDIFSNLLIIRIKAKMVRLATEFILVLKKQIFQPINFFTLLIPEIQLVE